MSHSGILLPVGASKSFGAKMAPKSRTSAFGLKRACLPLSAGGLLDVADRTETDSKLRTNRVRSYMSDDELQQFKALCAAHGTTEAQMVRTLVMAAVAGQKPPTPKPEKARQIDELIAGINALHVQLRKIGTNLNQIARQANTGLVPVSRNEILSVFHTVQQAAAAVQTAALKLLT